MKFIYEEITNLKRGEYNHVNSYIPVYQRISYLRYLWLKLGGYHCRKVLNENDLKAKRSGADEA